MTTDDATGDELERVRSACVDLGADEEMTELVLASHRHDRTLLDVMVADGHDLRDYVRFKVARWEAIFNEPEGPLPNRSPSRGSLWDEQVPPRRASNRPSKNADGFAHSHPPDRADGGAGPVRPRE